MTRCDLQYSFLRGAICSIILSAGNITYKIRQQPVFGFLQRRMDAFSQTWDNITRHMTFQQWEIDESYIRWVKLIIPHTVWMPVSDICHCPSYAAYCADASQDRGSGVVARVVGLPMPTAVWAPHMNLSWRALHDN